MAKRKRVNSTTKYQDNEEDTESSAQRDVAAQKKVRWGSKGEAVNELQSDESSEEEISENFEKICFAALCFHGRIGCAYYDPVARIIYILEDTVETLHFDLAQMLIEQVNPDIVLTSSKADDDFIDTLNEHMDKSEGTLQIRPFKEFVASKGRDRLLSLARISRLDNDLPASSDSDSNPSLPTNVYDFMRSRRDVASDPTSRRWNGLVRLANFASVECSPLCMASIGALLDHIVRERALGDFNDDGISGLDVRDIEILSLNQVMQINTDALMSLQVFENESHASVHSDKTKEGLSLFSILNNTKTTSGRCLLRTWLLRPSQSLTVIRSRHDTVECLSRSENLVTAKAMQGHLKGFKNISRIMASMHSGKMKLADWQGLIKFTFHATMLKDSLSELHETNGVEIVKKVTQTLDISTFKEIGVKINEIIDWEESSINDSVCVRPNIDEDLDNRKHVYHGIDAVLSNVAEQISQKIPQEFATSLNVVYFPQLGYLVCVPMLDEWRSETGIQPLEDWSFQFSSDAHVYFKSPEMQDMDTHIGDLHSTIADRELEIIQELLEEVLISDEAIGIACDVCAELDCLLSFAEASRLYNYRRPEMIEENTIEIIQGRHPLHEQVVDTFVPNDARLIGGAGIGTTLEPPDDSNQWNSVLLCTGANACGKSVYMKQVAVIQIMAQIGCFVPAESATLGIVDKIFTRVSTRESVSKVITSSPRPFRSTLPRGVLLDVQSAFMIDLAQVSLALRNCTARSLVLLDEFGKGTLSTDGAGLFCGVIRHLLNRGSNCPKVLVATHFHDVFNGEILNPESVPISFCHMQVMFTSRAGAAMESGSGDLSVATDSASTSSHSIGVTINTRMGVGLAEKITYLYRVAEGLSLNSHAAQCAEIFGVPLRIVKRAQYVSQLMSSHELGRLLDEEISEKERAELEDAESVCRRFAAWDLKTDEDNTAEGDVKRKLAAVLDRECEED